MHQLYDSCLKAISATAVDFKLELTESLAASWQSGNCQKSSSAAPEEIPLPGYPPQIQFVEPHRVPRRGVGSPKGRIHLFHAIAHIEFTSISLALDAVYRFRELPDEYVSDWLEVANEEVGHFRMIRDHLRELGGEYGELPVHDGLWRIAHATRRDPLDRMALVPRYLEARGLDVNPGMQKKLAPTGDTRGVEILEVILRDEIRHVAKGDRWFRHLCSQRDLDPTTTYRRLVEKHANQPWHGPFHCKARRQAGFGEEELKQLGCD
jgi:uncharacterized ferritin-like protein (DUF455 family)